MDEEHKYFMNEKDHKRIDGIVKLCAGQVFGEEALIKDLCNYYF